MFRKSLYIVGALAGALVWTATAQAASGRVRDSEIPVTAGQFDHMPLWLYDHTTDQDHLQPSHPGVRGEVSDGSGLGISAGGTHGNATGGGHGGDGGHGGGGGRH